MFRKTLAALAALSLAAQPALAADQKPKDADHSSRIITKQTLLPAAIIVVLILLVFGYTLHTKGNDKPASP